MADQKEDPAPASPLTALRDAPADTASLISALQSLSAAVLCRAISCTKKDVLAAAKEKRAAAGPVWTKACATTFRSVLQAFGKADAVRALGGTFEVGSVVLVAKPPPGAMAPKISRVLELPSPGSPEITVQMLNDEVAVVSLHGDAGGRRIGGAGEGVRLFQGLALEIATAAMGGGVEMDGVERVERVLALASGDDAAADPAAQEAAMLSIFNLCKNDVTNNERFATQGAVTLIAAALGRFEGDLNVARAGCWALYNLAFMDGNHRTVIEQGGVAALTQAAAAFPLDFEVQFACCQFFGSKGYVYGRKDLVFTWGTRILCIRARGKWYNSVHHTRTLTPHDLGQCNACSKSHLFALPHPTPPFPSFTRLPCSCRFDVLYFSINKPPSFYRSLHWQRNRAGGRGRREWDINCRRSYGGIRR